MVFYGFCVNPSVLSVQNVPRIECHYQPPQFNVNNTLTGTCLSFKTKQQQKKILVYLIVLCFLRDLLVGFTGNRPVLSFGYFKHIVFYY